MLHHLQAASGKQALPRCGDAGGGDGHPRDCGDTSPPASTPGHCQPLSDSPVPFPGAAHPSHSSSLPAPSKPALYRSLQTLPEQGEESHQGMSLPLWGVRAHKEIEKLAGMLKKGIKPASQ